MRAMVLRRRGDGGVAETIRQQPAPGAGQVLLRVLACGVCRTDLHVVDGDLPDGRIPIVPGHEIVGRVETLGAGVTGLAGGDRVGVPWLASSCRRCAFCQAGRENLCSDAQFTGYHIDGGYADMAVADASACVVIPTGYDDVHAAPLLCAGLIGHRAYRMSGPGPRLGIYGFGAAAHIITQVAVHDGREVFAFVAPGDEVAAQFARSVGAAWAGPSTARPPVLLDGAIIFAPVGALVPVALAACAPGATVVCAGIHMSDIPAFPYCLLWQERTLRSVANLTRQDAIDFMAIAARVPLRIEVKSYALADANAALHDLRAGRISGAAVLIPRGLPTS